MLKVFQLKKQKNKKETVYCTDYYVPWFKTQIYLMKYSIFIFKHKIYLQSLSLRNIEAKVGVPND